MARYRKKAGGMVCLILGCCGLRANHQTRNVTSTSRREKNYLEKLLMLKLNDKSWGCWGMVGDATSRSVFWGVHIFVFVILKSGHGP